MVIRVAFAALLNFTCAVSAIADASAPVQPFHADYEVLRNGKTIGKATLSVRDNGGGVWEFDSHTRGTSGMASLLGLDVSEKSAFRWVNGQPQNVSYRYEQSAAIKSRARDIDFDWNNGTAAVHDGKKTHEVKLEPNAIDRSLVTVALMADLQAKASQLNYHVVHADKISEERYVQRASESLNLPAGRIDAVRIDRDGGSNKRHTTSWFAPTRGWLPVKIEQVEKHGDTVTLELASAPR